MASGLLQRNLDAQLLQRREERRACVSFYGRRRVRLSLVPSVPHDATLAVKDLPRVLGAVVGAESLLKDSEAALRDLVAKAALSGLPVPALSSALAYFDTMRRARGTANMIQAQRDFFGLHSFERTDEEGSHHGPWAAG